MSDLPHMTPHFHKFVENPSVPGGRVAMWCMAGEGETLLSIAVPADCNHYPQLMARACNAYDAMVAALEKAREIIADTVGPDSELDAIDAALLLAKKGSL